MNRPLPETNLTRPEQNRNIGILKHHEQLKLIKPIIITLLYAIIITFHIKIFNCVILRKKKRFIFCQGQNRYRAGLHHVPSDPF